MTNSKNTRDSFIFYKGYMQSLEYISTLEEQIYYILSLANIGFFDSCADTEEEKLIDYENNFYKVLNSIPEEYNTIKALLVANKASLIKTYIHYLNGCKGGKYGGLGGAPKGNQNARKKQPQNNPETTRYVYVNDNVYDNVYVNDNDYEKEKEKEKEKENVYVNDNVYEEEKEEENGKFSSTTPTPTTMRDYYIFNSDDYKNVKIRNYELYHLIKQAKDKFTSDNKDYAKNIIKTLFDELNNNIANGKVKPYNESNPSAHYDLLCRYLGQKCKAENIERFIQEVKAKYNLDSLYIRDN